MSKNTIYILMNLDAMGHATLFIYWIYTYSAPIQYISHLGSLTRGKFLFCTSHIHVPVHFLVGGEEV